MTVVKQESMTAELAPDVYDGDTCDQIKHRWVVTDRSGDDYFDVLEINSLYFPPGSRVIVEEPVCPECGEVRDFDSINRKFVDRCDCGFDWIEWTYNEYS